MKAVIATFLLTMATAAAAADAPPSLISETSRKKAAQAVESGAFPSLVIGVISGEAEEILPLGVAVKEPQRKASSATVYEIGSVTKTFTALLLADAQVRGEVALDDPVQKLLPTFSIPKKGERNITLLDLATQSSGLPRLPDNLLPENALDPYADYDATRLRAFLSTYELPRAPGALYEYSNLGFGLLGHALATRAGSSYEELVRKRITGPLAMKDTGVTLTPSMAERFSTGHDETGAVVPPWRLGALEGAGALRSTAEDLLRYLKAVMNPSSSPLAKAATEVTRPRRPTDREEAKIGLAWQVETRQGKIVVWHNGMTGGYAAFAGFLPDSGRGVIVLTNISRDVSAIGFAELLGAAPDAAHPAEKKLTADELKEYEGTYRLAPQFDLVVRSDGQHLRAMATGQGELPVYASAKDEFFLREVDAQLSFQRDAEGRIESLILHQNGRNMPAPRVAVEKQAAVRRQEIKLEPAVLQSYVGRYPLAPGFALNVTLEEGQLYVQATAQARVPVYASAVDEFFYKVVDAQLSFKRGSDGSVQSLVLHQNGQDLPGRKQ